MMTPNTGNFLWSDYAPIYMELKITEYKKPLGTWRQNDNLIEDKKCEKEIRRAIKEYLQIHETDETAIPIHREIKCVVRGLFVKHGARLKKEKRTKQYN